MQEEGICPTCSIFMRRLTKAEKAAAAAVIGMTVTVAGAGIKLLKKHARYMAMKAAAFFDKEKEDKELEKAAMEAGFEAESEEETDSEVKAETETKNEPQEAAEPEEAAGAEAGSEPEEGAEAEAAAESEEGAEAEAAAEPEEAAGAEAGSEPEEAPETQDEPKTDE